MQIAKFSIIKLKLLNANFNLIYQTHLSGQPLRFIKYFLKSERYTVVSSPLIL